MYMYKAKVHNHSFLSVRAVASSYSIIIILQKNGHNVMRFPACDVCAFALQLMDTLFTMEELSKSLLYKSDKSKKPGLDEERSVILSTTVTSGLAVS